MVTALGERLCRPMQARWPLDQGGRQLLLSLDEPGPATIGDALFVQRELTGDLLDLRPPRPGRAGEPPAAAPQTALRPAMLAMRWWSDVVPTQAVAHRPTHPVATPPGSLPST